MNLSLRWVPFLLLLIAWPGRSAEKAVAGSQFFGTDKVVALHLSLTDKQFTTLTPKGGGFGPGFGPPKQANEGTHRNTFGVEFPWSQGELTWGTTTYKNVGVRYKGNYTYMATARSLQKSLKIDINRNDDAQKLDGLTMLNFHCGVSDASGAREAFSFAFFREAGIPAPRTCFAELTLSVAGKYDKELVGLYTVTEQVNKGFLKRHFKDGSGMLLKPEGLQGGLLHFGTNWRAYEDRYKPDAPPTDEQKKRLIDFTKLINTGSDDAFAKDIGTFLDVEAFLKFIAANALLSNMDSYLGYGHNYYLYLVPKTNQFVFIPWDLDLSLATWPAVGTPEQLVTLSIHHPHAGENKLIDRLFAIKEHKERYHTLLKDMTQTSFTKKLLSSTLDGIEKALREPLAREAKAVAARKEGGGGGGGFGAPPGGQFGWSMPPRRFIDKRLESVTAQLEGKAKGFEPKPISFGPPSFKR